MLYGRYRHHCLRPVADAEPTQLRAIDVFAGRQIVDRTREILPRMTQSYAVPIRSAHRLTKLGGHRRSNVPSTATTTSARPDLRMKSSGWADTVGSKSLESNGRS
jgi:hypothetical protein